jgi:hypothetical protein
MVPAIRQSEETATTNQARRTASFKSIARCAAQAVHGLHQHLCNPSITALSVRGGFEYQLENLADADAATLAGAAVTYGGVSLFVAFLCSLPWHRHCSVRQQFRVA